MLTKQTVEMRPALDVRYTRCMVVPALQPKEKQRTSYDRRVNIFWSLVPIPTILLMMKFCLAKASRLLVVEDITRDFS